MELTAYVQTAVVKIYCAQVAQLLLLVAALAASAALAVGLHASGLGWAPALAVVFAVDVGVAVLLLLAVFVRRHQHDDLTQLPGFLRSGQPLAPQFFEKVNRILNSVQLPPQQHDAGHSDNVIP